MVDWMIEVLTNFRNCEEVFFLSVSLMDRYFAKKRERGQFLEISELHAIGVTSMFIASKFEDLKPLKMRVVYEKIGHKKLTVEEIKRMELDILKCLNYKV